MTRVRSILAIAGIALAGWMSGCSSDPPPPPELTPAFASSAILQRWAAEELNHFRVTFHSDTLVECGVNHGLWKLAEVTDSSGQAWSTAYQLTDKGKQLLTAIDLKESGRGHEITLKGPYRLEITSIADGGPNNRRVGLRWAIDWDKASADLKACMPQFELAGNELASFELANGQDWRFASFMTAADIQAQQGAGSVLDKLH